MAGRNATWALISEEKIMNIIDCREGYEMANQLARACYGDQAIAVNVNQWTCGIGDTYKNGMMYYTDSETHEVVPYKMLPTDEQQIALLVSENGGLQDELMSSESQVWNCRDIIFSRCINLSRFIMVLVAFLFSILISDDCSQRFSALCIPSGRSIPTCLVFCLHSHVVPVYRGISCRHF